MSKFNQQSTFSVSRVFNALHYALKGLKVAWRNETAFRQEVVAILILLPIAVWLADSLVEFLLLLGAMLFVLLVEIINSAIEATVDRIGSERHELSGNAKDLGGAAVLLSLVLAAMVWLGVLLN